MEVRGGRKNSVLRRRTDSLGIKRENLSVDEFAAQATKVAVDSLNFVRNVPRLIGNLYKTVGELNELCPGRPFTPDGHLVGSIGEVVAAYIYDLTLEKCSNLGFDARTRDGQTVEIKLTAGDSVSIASDCDPPAFLIVFQLDTKTGFTEVYNGEFPVSRWRQKTPSKRRVVSLRVSELKKIKPVQPLEKKHSIGNLNQYFASA
jgi:hypothetical protein